MTRFDPHALPEDGVAFLTERHLATLTTLRPDGTPHVVAIAFTVDVATATARVITNGASRKVRNVEAAGPDGGPAALAQVDGRRWLCLEGRMRVVRDPDAIADAVQRYAVRFRPPRVNPERVLLLMDVSRVMGNL